MAVQVRIDEVRNAILRPGSVKLHDRERRLHLTARRRRLARIRRTAEAAAWVVGSALLAVMALGGLAGLR